MHTRELTSAFTCLLKILFGNTTSIPLSQRGDTLGIFLLTINVTIKIPGNSLHIPNQAIHIQSVLLPNISFDFYS